MDTYKQLTLEELKKQGYQLKEQDTFFMKEGKLDIKALEEKGTSVDASDGYQSYTTYYYDTTLDNGTYINISGNKVNGYSKQIIKKDDYLKIFYGYYPSGALKTTGMFYDNSFNKGTGYWYNEKGQINRLEEYDRPYAYAWEDVLQFMKEKNIEREDIYEIHREVKKEKGDENPYWYITKVTARDGHGNPTTAVQYTLDGNTGKVLKEDMLDVTRHLE